MEREKIGSYFKKFTAEIILQVAVFTGKPQWIEHGPSFLQLLDEKRRDKALIASYFMAADRAEIIDGNFPASREHLVKAFGLIRNQQRN